MLVGNVNNLRAYRKLRMQNVVLFSLLRASGFILDRRLQISKGMAQNTHISYLQANRKDSSLEKQSLHLFWRHICGWMTLYLSQWEPLCLQKSLASILPSRWGNHSDIIYLFIYLFFLMKVTNSKFQGKERCVWVDHSISNWLTLYKHENSNCNALSHHRGSSKTALVLLLDVLLD